MAKYTIKYTKTKDLKFISHLDTLRVMQRAISRVNLPIAYSEGYNPHMKMSFGFPISLGVESVGEYFEIELTKDLEAMEVASSLGESLPLNMKIVDCIKTEGKDSLMARTAYFDYSIILDEVESDVETIKTLIDRMKNEGIEYTKIRKKKKKTKVCNTRDFIEEVEVLGCDENVCALRLVLRLTETGSVKISELVDILRAEGLIFKYYSAIKTETMDASKKPLIYR